MGDRRVIVVGAGVGGLAAAMLTAAKGYDTIVLESAPDAGGKLREEMIDGHRIDAGPTVFTMRDVFEELFAQVGASLGDYLALKRATVLARHAWPGGAQLDLTSDIDANADAIRTFAGPADARGYRSFVARGAAMLKTLDQTFMRASRPNPLSLAARVASRDLSLLSSISPFETLWDALGAHFRDPRLRQLFGRYATYCGSSPFLAPATLMLIAEVERQGVWYVEGGMRRLADAMVAVAQASGARFRFNAKVERILVARGRAGGVVLNCGEQIEGDAVIFNGDASALGAGLLGASSKNAAPAIVPRERSLSAVTLAGVGSTRGFPLVRHNVFFGRDYAAEFNAIFQRDGLPAEPTTYVCASDREDDRAGAAGEERLFVLVNAPAADAHALGEEELNTCQAATNRLLGECGLTIDWKSARRTTPADFALRFPGTAGALYGPASHGWQASFRRPGAKSRLSGLYLAGGSVHPGAGVPMAVLSGRQAAQTLLSDLASTRPSARAATVGGTSML